MDTHMDMEMEMEVEVEVEVELLETIPDCRGHLRETGKVSLGRICLTTR